MTCRQAHKPFQCCPLGRAHKHLAIHSVRASCQHHLRVEHGEMRLRILHAGESSLHGYHARRDRRVCDRLRKRHGENARWRRRPVDQDAGALPRQIWIDFCTVLASVLRFDSPQEPAKDRTAPLRPITLQRPSQRLNHQILRENSRTLRNRAKFSLSVLKSRKRKEVI